MKTINIITLIIILALALLIVYHCDMTSPDDTTIQIENNSDYSFNSIYIYTLDSNNRIVESSFQDIGALHWGYTSGIIAFAYNTLSMAFNQDLIGDCIITDKFRLDAGENNIIEITNRSNIFCD